MSEELRQMFYEAERRGDRATAEKIMLRLEQAQTPQPQSIPDAPMGATYSGPIGRMQMDVGMGKAPALVGRGIVFELARKFGDWAADEIGQATPQVVKDWLKYELGATANALPKDFMKAISESMESFQQWTMDNPEKARGIESLLTGVGIVVPQQRQIRQAMKAGKLDKSLTNSVTPYKNQANIDEMMSDGRLKGLDILGRGGRPVDQEGWGMGIGKSVFIETDAVKAQKKALRTVPGFNPWQSNIYRRDLVNDEIINASKILQDKLDALGKTPRGMISEKNFKKALSKKNIKNTFNRGADRDLDPSEFMSDTEYQELLNDIKFRITSKRADGAFSVGEIHRQRKLLDHRYRNAKNDRRLDGKLQPTRDEMKWRTKRDILNNMVDRVSPGSKKERARIKALYDVREILHQKATKGRLYIYEDVKQAAPFVGESAVRILPGGGR